MSAVLAAMAIVGVIAWWCARLIVHDVIATRSRAAARRAMGAAIAVMQDEIEAGGRPDAALTSAALVAPGHSSVLHRAALECRYGRDAAAVLRSDDQWRSVARAWHVSTTVGAPLAAVLGRVGGELDARDDLARQVHIVLTGPRASAAMVAVLPIVGVVLGSAMGARPLSVLLGTHAGRLLLVLGVGLDAAGVAWTQWLVRRAEPP